MIVMKSRDESRESDLERVIETVARLRSEDGCPWDREQTLESLKECLLEESHELLEVMTDSNPDKHREELGDVLLQILMQARIREERGDFSFSDVARELGEKLIRRHPHVFGEQTVADSNEVLKNWEKIKASEKKGSSGLLNGIPSSLPSLQKAQRVQARAARVGFDWEKGEQVLDKIEEETGEMREAAREGNLQVIEEELGDMLFSIVNLCRFYGINAEGAVERTTEKFMRRFGYVESRLADRGLDLSGSTLDEMEELWQEAKKGD